MFKLNRENTTTFLLIIYLIAVVVFMILKSISITPDRLFIFLLIGALIAGRGISFLRDWIPFFALLLGYEMLRGFADGGLTVHVGDVLAAEKALFFGHVPTQVLQSWLYHPGHVQWYDIGASVIYFLHFPLPLILGFFLWLKNRREYYKFIFALLLLSFSGFITYLLYPAAPPWYAADHGLVSGVNKILNVIITQIGWHWNLSYYYSHLNPNPVAAIPSLHAAYPFLAFLALRHYSKLAGWIFLPYCFLVWFSIVYLGEHYVIDALLGVAYATLAYNVAYHLNFAKAGEFVKINLNLKSRSLPLPNLRFLKIVKNIDQ